MPINLGRQRNARQDVSGVAEEAAKARIETRNWETKYEAMRKQRQVIEGVQSAQLASLKAYIAQQEEEKAAMSYTIRELESLLLKERHRCEALETKVIYNTATENRLLGGCIDDLDILTATIERLTREICDGVAHKRDRMTTSDQGTTGLQGQLLDLRHQCATAYMKTEHRIPFAPSQKQQLESANEQMMTLNNVICNLEISLENEKTQVNVLQIERSALIQAISVLQVSKSRSECGGDDKGFEAQEQVFLMMNLLHDAMDALEMTLRKIPGILQSFLIDSSMHRESENKLNAMLHELQDSFSVEISRRLTGDSIVSFLKDTMDQLAEDLQRKERLIFVLEQQLDSTHNHAMAIEAERAALQYEKILAWHAARDCMDTESAFIRQFLLETTAQLACSQSAVNDVYAMSREFDAIEKVLDNLQQVIQLANLESSCWVQRRQESSECSSKFQSLQLEYSELEAEKNAIELSAIECLAEAENGLRKLQSRTGKATAGFVSDEGDQIMEILYFQNQSQIPLLRDEIARLEDLLRSEKLESTRKQNRIESLGQHLEKAQLRGREQAAALRERCNWLEAREGEMEVQILQEVENRKRMLSDMEELVTSKELLEMELSRLSKLVHSMKRQLSSRQPESSEQLCVKLLTELVQPGMLNQL